MEENKLSLQIIGDGELLVSDESGQRVLLNDMVLEAIFEFYDTIRVKKMLMKEKVVADEPDNIKNLDRMAEYYIAKRNEVLELMHLPVFLSYAFDQLDTDDLESEILRYEEILGYDAPDGE